MKKRLIVCCDGTWQSLESSFPTNVVKIAQAVKLFDEKDNIPQFVYYDEGLGTGAAISKEEDFQLPLIGLGIGAGTIETILESISGGAFGKGIDKNIQDAYRFLCLNYEPGDEIYLFGFSRGSYTVRSLAGMMFQTGMLRREHVRHVPKAYEDYRANLVTSDPKITNRQIECCHKHETENYPYHARITLLACWDTVGSLGVPDQIPFLPGEKLINGDRYRFHNTTLNPIVDNALHACAIDELRKTFDLTPMVRNQTVANQKLLQCWFPGDHGSVGGGSDYQKGLSDGALEWMMDKAQELTGLALDRDKIVGGVAPDPTSSYEPDTQGLEKIANTFTSRLTWGLQIGEYRRTIPANNPDNLLHPSAKERREALGKDYDPKNVPPELWATI